MTFRPSVFILLASVLAGCGGALSDDSGSADDLRHRHHDGGVRDGGSHDGGVHDGGVDAGTPPGGACSSDDQCTSGDLCSSGACVASACNQRHAGVTGIRATVRIDQYRGLIQGRNGTHELANATLQNVLWIYDASVEDTSSVQLAMNVASSTDPSGLPQEIPLSSGQVIEIEGEYIPAATANASGRAVVHYTHVPCGFVTIGGVTY